MGIFSVALSLFGFVLAVSTMNVHAEHSSERFLVAFGVGGTVDMTARWVARHRKKMPSVVHNRPGASGSIAVNSLRRESCVWLFGTDRLLDEAESRSLLRAIPKLSKLSADYQSFKDRDEIYWFGLAWVRFNECELKERDACKPEEKWMDCGSTKEIKHCIEDHGDEEYVVKMRVGHRGFFVPSVGASDQCTNRHVDLDSIVATAEMEELSYFLSKMYLLSAYGNGRKVSFELYRPGDRKPHRTVGPDKATPNLKVTSSGSSGVGYNTCGGKASTASACPAFFDLGDLGERQKLEKLGREFAQE